MKKALFVALALVASALSITTGLTSAGADGTEQLGPLSPFASSGTDFVIGGRGMAGTSTGSFTVAVPSGVTVKQVLLYWEGQHSGTNNGDPTIVVNGTSTTGKKIGGKTKFFGTTYATAYRADVTSRNLVNAGSTTTFSISGLAFNKINNGVGAIVVTDDGSDGEVALFDGLDMVYEGFSGNLKVTAPKTFTFQPSNSARVADLIMHVGDAGVNRPNQVTVTIPGAGTQTFHTPFHDTSGPEWDAVTLAVDIPANATSATVQVLSNNDGTTLQPASLAWVAAGLAVPEPVNCLPGGNPSASGRAFGIEASLLATPVIPPTPDTDVTNPDSVLALDVFKTLDPTQPTIAADTLLGVINTPAITGAAASDDAVATANDLTVTVPGLTVSATTVRARSLSTATGFGAVSTSAGSTIQGLAINGALIGDFSEPVTIPVTNLVTGAVVAEVALFEKVPVGAAAGVPQPEGVIPGVAAGDFHTGLTVNAIHIRVPASGLDPGLGFLDSDVVVASARSEASFGSLLDCEEAPIVAGNAFTTRVQNANPALVSETTGLVTLGSNGGHEHADVAALPPLTSGAGSTDTQSDTTVSPLVVASHADLAGIQLGGASGIVASALTTDTTSTSGGDTGNAVIANLVLGGTDVCTSLTLSAVCTPAPNTWLLGPGSAPLDMLVLLNEQVPSPTGGITVNAVHIFVLGSGNPLGLPAGAEVILSSATSDVL